MNKNYELWIYRPEKCIFPIFCVCILLLLLDARRSRWLNIKRQLAHANLRHVSSGPCRLTTMWAAGCEFNKSGSPRTRITDSHPLGRLGKFESPARLAKLPQVAGVSSLVSLFFWVRDWRKYFVPKLCRECQASHKKEPIGPSKESNRLTEGPNRSTRIRNYPRGQLSPFICAND